jgi:YD repeat-containing protein
MNCTNVSRRGFFAQLTAACGWLAVRTTEPSQRPLDDAALTTSYRYDDLGRIVSETIALSPKDRRPKLEDLKPKT